VKTGSWATVCEAALPQPNPRRHKPEESGGSGKGFRKNFECQFHSPFPPSGKEGPKSKIFPPRAAFITGPCRSLLAGAQQPTAVAIGELAAVTGAFQTPGKSGGEA